MEHFVQDRLKRIKFRLTALFVHFLIETEILEPKRTVLRIVFDSFFTNGQRLIKVSFTLLITRGFEEKWPIGLAFVHKVPKLPPSSLLVADSTFKKSSFKQHFPALFNRHICKLADESSHRLDIAELLLDLDCLDEEVFIQVRELQALDENFSGLLLVPTLFFHLGILEPALVREGLQVGDKLKENLCFFEPALTLGVVSQVQNNSPVHLARDVQDSHKSLFDHLLEAILFLLLHVTANLLVLVLAVWRFIEVLLQARDSLPALHLCLNLSLSRCHGVLARGILVVRIARVFAR